MYFPVEIFTNIISYCDDRIERNQKKLWNSIKAVNKEYSINEDTGDLEEPKPNSIYLFTDTIIYVGNIEGMIRCDVDRDVYEMFKLELNDSVEYSDEVEILGIGECAGILTKHFSIGGMTIPVG